MQRSSIGFKFSSPFEEKTSALVLCSQDQGKIDLIRGNATIVIKEIQQY